MTHFATVETHALFIIFINLLLREFSGSLLKGVPSLQFLRSQFRIGLGLLRGLALAGFLVLAAFRTSLEGLRFISGRIIISPLSFIVLTTGLIIPIPRFRFRGFGKCLA